MKRLTIVLAGLAAALYLGGIPALGQHGHAGGGAGHSNPHAGASSSEASSKSSSKPTTTGKRTVSELLTHNTQLASKINSLTGMNARQACSGFKNLGQCVAAAHVSKNLDIPFANLKAKMLGTSTGTATSKPMSLGQAIQALSPHANVKAETRKAKKQADDDFKETSS